MRKGEEEQEENMRYKGNEWGDEQRRTKKTHINRGILYRLKSNVALGHCTEVHMNDLLKYISYNENDDYLKYNPRAFIHQLMEAESEIHS